MTKQKEIKKRMKELIRMYNPTTSEDRADWEAGLYLHYLNSQNVVILKQGLEFPTNALVGSVVESLVEEGKVEATIFDITDYERRKTEAYSTKPSTKEGNNDTGT